MTDVTDAALAAWLREGPESGPPEPLARTLALTRSTRQRPGWLVRERGLAPRAWPARQPALAAMVVVVLAALLAAALVIAAVGRPTTPFDNDPIPMPPTLSVEVEQHIAGYGYRLDPVPADAGEPRISASQATEIAERRFLDSLRAHATPVHDPTHPEGVVRRQLYDPNDGSVQVVWLVTYRWQTEFECRTADGTPDVCPGWDAWVIDDQTGDVVTGFSLVNARAGTVTGRT